jgi:pilus assembly protein Flp/PilA
MVLVQRFAADQSGATAIEYGLMAALIAVACIAAFMAFGASLTSLFDYVRGRSTNVMDAAGI